MLGKPFKALLATSEAPEVDDPRAIFLDSAEDAPSRIIELTGRRSTGVIFALEACSSRWKNTDGFNYGFVLRDVSERKREEERIRFLAEHDVLTGLANRSKVNEELARLLVTAEAAQNAVAVVLLGLDRFKDLNDTLGQDRGDKVICAVGDRLRDRLSALGLVARVSGDEFAVVLALKDAANSACAIVELIAREFAQLTIQLDDRAITVAHSVGSAVFPRDGTTAPDLMANAYLALQDAKLRHRGGHVAYRSEIRSKIEAVRQLEKDLNRAFERNEFELFYQPQFDMTERKIVGAEALIRWRHPQRGLVSPGEFIPVLDTMPLSDKVGLWVIETACKQASEWHLSGHDVRIGINLAPSQFETDALPEIIAGALEATNLPSSLIELEVTEHILLEDNDRAAAMLRRIRDTGVVIAFDDFGTGYASLTYLKRFPLDRLKIDQTFVRDMVRNPDDRAIVSALVGLGKLLDMQIIAEGIEDLATADALMQMGCGEGQGYYFGRPVPAQEFFQKYLLASKTQPQHSFSSTEISPAA